MKYSGEQLFSALYDVYCLTLASLKAALQNSVGRATESSQTNKPTEASAVDTDGFQERKRKKRNITGEKSPPKSQTVTSVPTRKFFTPLNSADMDTEDKRGDEIGHPPIIVTTNIKLIQAQQEIKTKLKADFTLPTTRNEIRLITKTMEDYSTLKNCLEQNQTHYYTFHPKAEKPTKAVIRHLPGDAPAEDTAKNRMPALGYKVHNVRKMTTSRQQ